MRPLNLSTTMIYMVVIAAIGLRLSGRQSG